MQPELIQFYICLSPVNKMGKVVEVLMVVLAVVLLYDLQFEVASCLFPDYCRIAQLVMAVLRCHYIFL